MKTGKTLITLGLCVAFILPNHVLIEVFKFPAFLTHFIHHHQDHDEGLAEFMHDHYGDAKHHEEDHGDHDQLPFTGHQHNAECIQAIVLFAPSSSVSLKIEDISIGKGSFFHYRHNFCPEYFPSIWQPPKSG